MAVSGAKLPPASLKDVFSKPINPEDLMFPGRSCPGLIEGSTGPTSTPSCRLRFRGEAAPASLKQDWPKLRREILSAFPGRSCPRPH